MPRSCPIKASEIGPDTIRDWLRSELDLSPQALIHVRRVTARVFRAGGAALPSTLAVKVCCDESGELSIADAELQHRSLLAASACLNGSTENSIVNIVPLLRDRGCLVTEWVDGRALNGYWGDWRISRHELLNSAVRAGDWLRAFHDCRTLTPRELATAELMERLRELCGAAAAEFRSSSVVSSAARYLGEVSQQDPQLIVPTSWLHGDFKPANLILSGRVAIGLDLTLRYENAVVFDMAPFLLELDLMCFELKTCRLSMIRAEMERAFLAGYSRNAPVSFQLALAWAKLHLALCVWAAREAPDARSARNWYLRKRLQVIVPRLVRDLAAARARSASG